MPLIRRPRAKQAAARSFEPSRSRVSTLDRLIFFSDGVHAIAITLLVLPITVPAVAEADLGRALADSWREYFAYALSFVVIGVYWMLHHRVFDRIVREDRVLLRLNLVLLACIAFLPFPTAVLGDYGSNTAAVTAYAASIAATGLVWSALWWWASSGRRLIDDELTDAQIRARQVDSAMTPLVFGASILVAQVNPGAAEIMWALLIPLGAAIQWYYGRDSLEAT
jgi:uncharacterized membrane protein